jgi:hypothetical protein
MEQCWLDAFPPVQRPCEVVPWIVISTLSILRYCCEPVGNVFAVLVLVGAIRFWRGERRSLLVLLLLPIALALVASFLKSYPYSGARVLAFATPAVVLLIADAIPPVWTWLRRHTRVAWMLITIVLFAPVGQVACRLFHQGGRSDCAGATAFVLANRQPSETVISQSWEARYYLRGLGPAYQPWENVRSSFPDRFWLIDVAGTAVDRQRIVSYFTVQNWRVERHSEFTRASVYLLDRAPRAVATDESHP